MNELETIRSEPGIFQRAMEGGPIVLGALGVLVLAGILFLAWAFLAIRRRRISPLLGAAAVGLGLLGYIAYDRNHLFLNLSMRDAQSVRQDCIRLLQHRQATAEGDFRELTLHGSELPTSFTRIGAAYVRVTRNNVQISLIPDAPLTSSAWGFLYDPNRSYLTEGWPDHVRPTWYHDFYEFRVRGE